MDQPRIGQAPPGPLPELRLSPAAAQRIREFRARAGHPEAWVSVTPAGLRGDRLAFTFALVESGEPKPDEILVQGAEDVVFVTPRLLARHVIGAQVDADDVSGALSLETAYDPDADPLAGGIQRLLDEEINPAVAAHGGYISLLEVAEGVAYVQMGGGCQGCGLAEVTLSQGVRTAILERFSEIQNVIDTTDHALGSNPYYQPAKK